MIDAHQHTLQFEHPAEPLVIDGDRVRISQVVENLLANAAKYTPDGGSIFVSLCRKHGNALLSVRDNGRGIPSEMLQPIFDLFVQSDNTLDRADGGMGVGLTLVRSLVELHGGSIVAQSDGPGRGSEFLVSLPLSSEAQAVPAVPPPARPSSGARVLIVEDNPGSREILKALLELDGLEVAVAENGAAGLEAVRRRRPDRGTD